VVSTSRDFGNRQVDPEEVAPGAHDHLQQVPAREPSVLRRFLPEVDQQVALSISAYGKRALNITSRPVPCTLIEASVNRVEHERNRGDSQGVEGLHAAHVFGTVPDLMNKGHPN
jgi:hypothetical protein